jgi:ABC-2 type transport system permease protein
MTIFRFTLKRVFRSPLNLLLVCVLPVGAAFLPSAPGWPVPIGFYMYGAIILYASFLMLRSVVEDGLSGIFQRIGAAPVTYLRYLWETLLAYGLILVIQNAVMVGLGVLIHGDRIPSPLLLFVAYTAFSVTSLALCLAAGSLFRNREAAYGTISGVLMFLGMIGGFFWPLEIMPPALRRAAMATPCYWLVQAVQVLSDNGTPGRFALCLAIMLLYAVAFLLVGSRRRMA